jgi:hypothetical protein
MTPNAFGAVKHAYAGLANGVGRGLTAAKILGTDPPPREKRVRHWAYSLTKVHDAAEIAKLEVPWWTYRAIDEVDAWLAGRRHQAEIFEYGSGASTVWLAQRAARIRSVEHHRGFAESITPTIAAHKNAELLIIESDPSANPVIGSQKEGYAGQDFSKYVAAIDDNDDTYDLIVVDGRAREACLAAALPHLKPDGIIVFDNSLRRRYAKAIEETTAVRERRLVGLTPTLPYPDCTSVLTLRATG